MNPSKFTQGILVAEESKNSTKIGTRALELRQSTARTLKIHKNLARAFTRDLASRVWGAPRPQLTVVRLCLDE